MFNQVHVFLKVLVFIVLTGCAGHVEETPEPETFICEVPWEGIVCSFECADCENLDDCDGALPTALDHCSFQKHNP